VTAIAQITAAVNLNSWQTKLHWADSDLRNSMIEGKTDSPVTWSHTGS